MTETPPKPKRGPHRFSSTNQPKRATTRVTRLPEELRTQQRIPKAALRAMTNKFLEMPFDELQRDVAQNETAPAVYRLVASLIVKAVKSACLHRAGFLFNLIEEDKELNKYLQTVTTSTREQILTKAKEAIKQLEGEIEAGSAKDEKIPPPSEEKEPDARGSD